MLFELNTRKHHLSVNSSVKKNDIILLITITIKHLAQFQQTALCGHKKLFER